MIHYLWAHYGKFHVYIFFRYLEKIPSTYHCQWQTRAINRRYTVNRSVHKKKLNISFVKYPVNNPASVDTVGGYIVYLYLDYFYICRHFTNSQVSQVNTPLRFIMDDYILEISSFPTVFLNGLGNDAETTWFIINSTSEGAPLSHSSFTMFTCARINCDEVGLAVERRRQY